MTITVQATNLILSSSNLWNATAASDTFWLTEGTIAANTQSSGAGIFSSFKDFTVIIDGSLYADYNGIYATGQRSVVSIGVTGAIHSTGSPFGAGLTLNGSESILNNAGHLDYTDTIAVFASGANSQIINSGTIYGAGGGIRISADSVTLDNSGSISAGTTANTDADHGHGVILLGLHGVVSNSGLISATSLHGAGIAVGQFNLSGFGSDAIIINQAEGLIRSAQAWGIDASQLSATETGFTLTNTGEIAGATGSVFGSNAGDTITNAGTLTGAVNLGDGSDKMTNTGTILGGVAFGSGTDTLWSSGTITGAVTFGAGTNAYTNSGLVSGGVQMAGTTNVLVNSGAITGEVAFLSGTSRLVNHGTIFGDVTAQDGATTLRNFGTITDDVSFGAGANVFVNRGTVQGDVSLGNGASSYSGTFGHVLGTIIGGVGAQTITAGSDDGTINGGGGNDTISGGLGNDDLTGGNGIDVLTGGAGTDTFHFLSSGVIGKTALHETITDFTTGTDKIELSFMHGADFLGGLAFSNTAGEIRYVAASGQLQGDVNGDGNADWILQLSHNLALTVNDLIL